MKIRQLAVPFAIVLLIGLTSYTLGGQEPDPRQDQFRRDMLTKVGEKISFIGTVRPGKFGPYVTPDDWVGIYIETRTTNRADLAKLNSIDRQQGRRFRVEGVLHLAKESPGREIHGVPVSGIPEHFFFDVAEISFSESKVRPDAKSTKK